MELQKNAQKPIEQKPFVDRMEPLPVSRWLPASIGHFFWNLLLKLADFLWTVVYTLYTIVIGFGKFLYRAALGIWNGCKTLGRKFRFNDWSGRVSFFVFGVSSLKNKRWVNGFLYLISEIAYVVCFIVFGIPSIAKLDLTATDAYSEVCHMDADLGYEVCEKLPTNNSVMTMVYGLLWVFSIALFAVVWKNSVETGYRNYRITHYESFAHDLDVIHPYSMEIDQDMEEHQLSEYSFKELKARYVDVYAKLNGLFTEKIDQDYARYVLGETIANNCRFHASLRALAKKAETADKKIADISHDEAYEAQLKVLADAAAAEQAKLSEMDGPYWAQVDAMKLNPLPAGSSEEQAFRDLEKARKAQRNKSLDAGDKYIAFKARHDKKVERYSDRKDKALASIADQKKHYLAFVEQESAKNSSSYGRFNVYYRQVGTLQNQKTYFTNYAKILAAYRKGEQTFGEANAANEAQKAKLTEDYNAKVKAITDNYNAIYQKRADVEARNGTEKTAYQSKVAELKAKSAPAAELAEAKAVYQDHLRTIRGILDGLPTVKQIKGMEKEELGNVTHAYKRDTKALKTNYTPEEYASYCATNAMILDCSLPYEVAREFVKDTKAAYSDAEVKTRLQQINEQSASYVEGHPTHFDGQPKTFKEDVRSLFDEKFHTTLLTLPILGCVIFVVMPLIFSILVAFTNYSYGHVPPTQTFNWVGFKNFVTLFNPDPQSIYAGLGVGLSKTLLWTLVWAVLATFSNYYLGIIFALLINKDGVKLKKMWRTIFVMSIAIPQFISLIGMSILLKDSGAFGQLWQSWFGSRLGFGTDKANDAFSTKLIIILVNIWVGVPYTILSTTGILLNIPKDLYESSEIDGAGKNTQFWSITMPYIRFVLGPSLIQTFIGNINNFGVIYFLTGGGPDRIASLSLGYTDLLITFLYKMVTSANNPQFGLASTIGILVFLLCAFFSIIMYNKSDAITKEDQFQ